MLDDRHGHVPRVHEVAQPLEGLEQHQDPEPGDLAAGTGVGQLEFGLDGRIGLRQVTAARLSLSLG